jgi:hypothetical protein
MAGARRYISLPGECLPSPAEVVVEVPLSMVGSVALELTLLLEALTESLRIRSSAGPTVVLTLLDIRGVSKAIARKDGASAICFALGRNQVEYLRAVLLRAYRDQISAVNHVHIEGELGGALFDLTVMFDVYREPMLPEEAAKRLAD